jgi:hypothetical protein
MQRSVTVQTAGSISGPMMFRRALLAAMAALSLGGTFSGTASAQQLMPRSLEERQERPRERPFSEIHSQLRRQFGGQLLDMRQQGGNYVVAWIDRDGQRIQLVIDAESGRIISQRGG